MSERETMMNTDVRADSQPTETIDLTAVSEPVGDTVVMPVAADDGAPTQVMELASGDTVVMPAQDGTDLTREMSTVEAPTEALPMDVQASAQVEAEAASSDEPTVPIDGPVPSAEPVMETGDAAKPDAGMPPSDGVPLYATQPPVNPVPGAPGNPWAQAPGMTATPTQPFVQVPVAAPAPLPEPQPKTGPSGPTIVFGVLMLILGVIGMFFGFGVSNSMFGLIDLLRVSPEAFIALCIGGLGVLLVVIAIVWGVAKAAHTRRASAQKDETDRSTANDRHDGSSSNVRLAEHGGNDTPRE